MRRSALEQAIFFSGKKKKQIATEANIPPSVLSKILSGKQRPSIDVAMRMASSLGVKVEDIFNAK